MKALKLIIAGIIILNTPAIVLYNYGPTLGSLLSYTSILLLFAYYILVEGKSSKLNVWLILLALTYFVISSFQYIGLTKDFINNAIKFFIVIICGYELLKRVSTTEMYFIILIGSLTIGIEAVFFPSRFGRYAGFYINPNVAGFICITGYSLTYGLKQISLKLFGQFVFTLMGLLTFSRTFIVIWVLLNLISLKISIKNIRIIGIGFLIISSLFFIDELVGLNNPRFDSLKKFVNNEQVSTREVNEDSRVDTWAAHYDHIMESPIFGSGYGTFSGLFGKEGVHNSYLMLLGEAGIIPLFIMLAMFIYMFYWSFILFKYAPNLLMQTIALSLFLLANHNFFNFYYILFAIMWIQAEIEKYKDILYQQQLKSTS